MKISKLVMVLSLVSGAAVYAEEKDPTDSFIAELAAVRANFAQRKPVNYAILLQKISAGLREEMKTHEATVSEDIKKLKARDKALLDLIGDVQKDCSGPVSSEDAEIPEN